VILRKYGIELHSLRSEDLEKVRLWRNDPFVRESMFFQEEISASDQQMWFSQMDASMVYFCINYQSECIGLMNVKNIDWKKRRGEAGIFIGIEKYRNSFLPMLAIFTLMDVFFEEFEFTQLMATVRSDNQNALEFNQALGYQIQKTEEDRIELVVDHTTYQHHKKKYASFLVKQNIERAFHTFSEEEKNYFFLPK
jgi:RimJ/RimL family protein N-acetyltransferase